MRLLLILGLMIGECAFSAEKDITIPYPQISSPVVHSGRYHVLSCGETYVILDSSRGMAICMIGQGPLADRGADTGHAVMTDSGLRASLFGEDEVVEIGQAYDPAARLQIIDQGPGRVAARVYFSLCSEDGVPHGSGTLDLYVYSQKIFLVPSIYVDYEKGLPFIAKAGIYTVIPGNSAELIVKGSKIMPTDSTRTVPFGEESEGFTVTVNNPGRYSMKTGWLRNSYPAWMYMNNIAENPETDELYEKWPLWITQRGNPLSWKVTPHSKLSADFAGNGLERLEFLWADGDSMAVAKGGYKALNGVMAVFLGKNALEVGNLWKSHEKPLEPEVVKGDFRYYNEIEGVYEIDSAGNAADVSFDNLAGTYPRDVFVRFWNLSGKSGYEVTANNKPVPFGLYNDGDILEDPMVSIVKQAADPARFAALAQSLGKGTKTRVRVMPKPGIQFVYQMYSDLETYESWSDTCNDTPLFRFHVKKGEVYHATLPGKDDYAFFKLPLYWLKNGVNQDTFMNHTRGFAVTNNGPDHLQFTYTGVNLQGTGLSRYIVTVPYERDCLTFDVRAEFSPLDDGIRWSSVEYCDLYPFEHVYRRDFHYRDVIFLSGSGEFDRVGTGAWGGGFDTVMEPERLGYYAESASREGPGTRTPSGSDGTVWILGNNIERGNILYRRGDWTPSPGASSVFSLCNAWVDIHNTVRNRSEPGSSESINYTVVLFPGQIPSLENLNTMYQRAAGEKVVKQVEMVNFSMDGEIVGFVVK